MWETLYIEKVILSLNAYNCVITSPYHLDVRAVSPKFFHTAVVSYILCVAKGKIVVSNVGIFRILLRVLPFRQFHPFNALHISISPFHIISYSNSFMYHPSFHSWLRYIFCLMHHRFVIPVGGGGGEAWCAPCAPPLDSYLKRTSSRVLWVGKDWSPFLGQDLVYYWQNDSWDSLVVAVSGWTDLLILAWHRRIDFISSFSILKWEQQIFRVLTEQGLSCLFVINLILFNSTPPPSIKEKENFRSLICKYLKSLEKL